MKIHCNSHTTHNNRPHDSITQFGTQKKDRARNWSLRKLASNNVESCFGLQSKELLWRSLSIFKLLFIDFELLSFSGVKLMCFSLAAALSTLLIYFNSSDSRTLPFSPSTSLFLPLLYRGLFAALRRSEKLPAINQCWRAIISDQDEFS